MNTYYLEVTDLFGGEMNYCYLNKHVIDAKSRLGAIQRLSTMYGLNFRLDMDCGDYVTYHSTSQLTGVTIEEYDDSNSNHTETAELYHDSH